MCSSTHDHRNRRKMFPPVAPDVLARNPHFRALYTELTTKILNPQDESTRARDAEGAAVLEQVFPLRI